MLKGKTINLIALEERYLDLIRKWRMQEEIYRYMFSAELITDIGQKKWFEKISSDKKFTYFLIMNKDSIPVGMTYLDNIDYKNGTTNWGIYIGELDYLSVGYGAEAEFLVLKYVFDYLRMNKVCIQVYSFNEKVIMMHSKFGFVQEGILRQQIYHNGAYQDVVLLGVLKKEFDEKRDGLEKIFNRQTKDEA